jgi:hypothetical protein
MSRASTPRPGRAWPAPNQASRAWLGRRPTRVTTPAAGDADAELACDLAVLIERGLVVPIHDGLTIRFALSTEEASEE